MTEHTHSPHSPISANALKTAGQKHLPELSRIRRHFHENPELGFEEFQTSAHIADLMECLGLEVRRNVAETGVVALLRGQAVQQRPAEARDQARVAGESPVGVVAAVAAGPRHHPDDARVGDQVAVEAVNARDGQLEGDLPIAEFVDVLHAGGYRGNLTIECTFDDFEPELTDALAFLRRLD